jgi:hypothetical protein
VTDKPGYTHGPHVTPDVLADLQAGLLHDRAEQTAHDHLAGCPACRGDLERLADIPGRLGAAGPVEPIPADVASRLDAALATAATEPADVAAASTVLPLQGAPAAHRRERSSPRGLRLLQAAAAAVVVLGLGGLAVSALHGGSDSGGTADTAGAASGGSAGAKSAAVPITASGRDWTPTTLAAAAPALAAGTYGPAFAAYDDNTRKSAASGSSVPTPAAPRLPSTTASGSSGPAEHGTAAGAAGKLADPTALRACVTNLTDGDTTMQPLAVDLARWQGQPAAVLVFPTAGDPASLDVYVVAPDCPTGLFLNFVRVPRS